MCVCMREIVHDFGKTNGARYSRFEKLESVKESPLESTRIFP